MDIFLSILGILGFIALTAGTGIFVAVEFALTGLERSAIVADRSPAGRLVERAHSDLSFQLSGAQLGITLTTLATGYVAEPVLSRFITPLLHAAHLSEASSRSVALVIAMIVAAILSMVYGELVPKNIAITEPMGVAKFTVRPVMAFNAVFSPFIRGLNYCANHLVRRMGIEPADELASARSPQELEALVRNSAEHGSLPQSQAALINRSLKFGDVSAEDIMTPRSKIETLDVDATVTDLLQVAQETGHSRFPLVDGDLDNTVGVVHVKQAFTVPADVRATTLASTLATPVPVVPDSLDGDAVLKIVRQSGCQMALVADEYGGTAGIVTMEDVVEEIVGAVFDEHDDTATETEIRRAGTSWDCSGLMRIDELDDKLGYAAPEGPYETLGGLVMAVLGRIPVEGDRVELPLAEHVELPEELQDYLHEPVDTQWVARVTAMDGRRVDRLLMTPYTPKPGAARTTAVTPAPRTAHPQPKHPQLEQQQQGARRER